MDSATAQMFFVHEIVHALQDQHFQLGAGPIRQPGNDDQAIASLAVIEGDASSAAGLAALFADGSAAILEPVVIEARDVAPEWG